ncbi:MAG: hypothetical protein JXR88_08665 [Clostridia bacterium]|nr:hypothetical protein [Clostridia bacterium]
MLRISWIFIIHDLIVTALSIGIISQLFYIKVPTKRISLFVIWIQVVFIFNDFVIEPQFALEWKYLVIFVGFYVGFFFFMHLSFLSSTLLIISNLIINGLATNINIFALLLTQYDTYGHALEYDFIQYSSLVMVFSMMYMLIKAFNIRLLDISRYDK